MMMVRVLGLLLVVGLGGCGDYRPGVGGQYQQLPQNAKGNSEPQPAGSLPK